MDRHAKRAMTSTEERRNLPVVEVPLLPCTRPVNPLGASERVQACRSRLWWQANAVAPTPLVARHHGGADNWLGGDELDPHHPTTFDGGIDGTTYFLLLR